jgi:hypothetical protein
MHRILGFAIPCLLGGCGSGPAPAAADAQAYDLRHGPDCAAGELWLGDKICNVTDDGFTCSPSGDDLCHAVCTTDKDCMDPGRPHCGLQTVFAGSDVNCSKFVRICRATAKDDCTK